MRVEEGAGILLVSTSPRYSHRICKPTEEISQLTAEANPNQFYREERRKRYLHCGGGVGVEGGDGPRDAAGDYLRRRCIGFDVAGGE